MRNHSDYSRRQAWYGCLLACLAITATGCTENQAVSNAEEPFTVNENAEPAKSSEASPSNENQATDAKTQSEKELATFGAGCFWCVEAVFEELDGVADVVSGYTGGGVDNPTYEQVCSGATGHAEVCQITYNPSRITYDQLLEVFFQTHDPTTLNRQGGDVGTQYRSVIYYHNEHQKERAETIKKKLDSAGAWSNPIVTEISPLGKFYEAELYHQDYYRLNPNQGYCQFVIQPKMDKFRSAFSEQLKSESR